MSIACHIAVQAPDGRIRAITLNHGMRPMRMLPFLNAHYTDPVKAGQLIGGGNLSTIGPLIGERNDWNAPDPAYCLYYRRDRGERLAGNLPRTYADVDALVAGEREPYVYLHRDGKWTVV